ncbi:hypothetical protein HYDPIDRAFT_33267 [Hydnomerulius pinastri MD-312]|uniref:Uncharacterized protein n=1 Tax=Hydnomerulius pinastri MD-312 TaxID=994086 RepID=A0A0C9V2C7_9AGAM|nr:hypothetical protein HYDPIDRAFT_33267 [Hydnomerulius pinastri MD-312]
MREYFPRGGLAVFDLEFDLGTPTKRKVYAAAASIIASNIKQANPKNIIVTISDHTDESSGDLFLGKEGCKDVAVMDVLLSPFKLQLPGGMLFILACGSIVRNTESYASLLDAIGRYNLFCAIMFDAARLQPIFTWPFLIHITEGVIIEGHCVEDVVEAALGTSRRLGRHTGVYLAVLCPTSSSIRKVLNITKYVWSHRDHRPWGQPLPVQCPQCGTLQKWQRSTCHHSTYIFKCHYHKCGWDIVSGTFHKPPHIFKRTKPKNVEVIQQGKFTAWLKSTLPPRVVDVKVV